MRFDPCTFGDLKQIVDVAFPETSVARRSLNPLCACQADCRRRSVDALVMAQERITYPGVVLCCTSRKLDPLHWPSRLAVLGTPHVVCAWWAGHLIIQDDDETADSCCKSNVVSTANEGCNGGEADAGRSNVCAQLAAVWPDGDVAAAPGLCWP